MVYSKCLKTIYKNFQGFPEDIFLIFSFVFFKPSPTVSVITVADSAAKEKIQHISQGCQKKKKQKKKPHTHIWSIFSKNLRTLQLYWKHWMELLKKYEEILRQNLKYDFKFSVNELDFHKWIKIFTMVQDL